MSDYHAEPVTAESEAVAVDAELQFEVAIAHSVDRAVARYQAKRNGWRSFTDFVELAPSDVQALIREQAAT